MLSPLLIDTKLEMFGRYSHYSDNLPGRKIINWSEVTSRPTSLDGIRYGLGWNHDRGLFARMKDLEIIFCAGAGVDHITNDPNLPDVPIVRFVDPSLTSKMSEWICLQCLMHLRRQRTYDEQQGNREWQMRDHPQAKNIRVGIMGLGVLGSDAAEKLQMLGFQVNGWSRTKKSVAGVTCFDENGLDEFLSQSDMIIGLLPLTEQTKGIYNYGFFEKLHKETPLGAPIFINAGRGLSQIEDDIIRALDNELLGGISLDVYQSEPLSSESALWGYPSAILTPHVASSTDFLALAKHVANQIKRHENGETLQHVIDPAAGY